MAICVRHFIFYVKKKHFDQFSPFSLTEHTLDLVSCWIVDSIVV